MGCTGSKQANRSRHHSPTPYNRSYSAPAPRHGKPGSHHVVSLASSTLGTLNLDRTDEAIKIIKTTHDHDFDMVERLIPKTPTKTPPHAEPETINAWELMAGLEDDNLVMGRSFSFDTTMAPTWTETAPRKSIVSDFDPEILSTFRKALEELSPQHASLLRSPIDRYEENGAKHDIPRFTGIVKARITAFQERIDARKAINNNSTKVASSHKCPPGGEGRLVFYFTSLRGVRKTYEDCWAVRAILQGYGVKMDERDVSMHGGYKEELIEILGVGYGGGMLPRVFADGIYLGGAEEVRQMHESGELGKALELCEMVIVGKGGVLGPCEGCGDVRFVPCEMCSGSCKVYVEEDDEEEDGGGFRRCPECNENGLVRCPLCC